MPIACDRARGTEVTPAPHTATAPSLEVAAHPQPAPLTAPAADRTRITVAASELPSFGLAEQLIVDVAAPFSDALTVLDRGTPAASIEIRRPGGPRPIKIYRPAMIESLDELARSYRVMSPETVVRRDDPCILAEPHDALASLLLDCFAPTANGPVLCSFEDPNHDHVEAARSICRSLLFR